VNSFSKQSARLSMQASLAQYYFQLYTLDRLQKILDNKVKSYKRLLEITKNRHETGVSAKLDKVTVESQLHAAEVTANAAQACNR
jgi:outer membrane protein TolC